jgi:hypothetical protein
MLKEILKISKILKEMKEADLRDSQGNVVIEPGLKVRHKASGLEYSVRDVEDTEGKTKIVLAVPEAPRVDSTKTFASVVTEDDKDPELDTLLDKIDQDQQTIFVVNEKEFQKEYEVK